MISRMRNEHFVTRQPERVQRDASEYLRGFDDGAEFTERSRSLPQFLGGMFWGILYGVVLTFVARWMSS